ncbi:hypothetical protein FQN57_007015 [Myotisia sp. PD_48]|nr:hypothetical protein FQN57_007015 [Myotisia sp. PD_48]
MRPTVPDAALTTRPRKHSPSPSPSTPRTTPSPASTDQRRQAPDSFFFARGDAPSEPNMSNSPQNSMYGVQSLEETINDTMDGDPLVPSKVSQFGSDGNHTSLDSNAMNDIDLYKRAVDRLERHKRGQNSTEPDPSLPATPLIIHSPAEPASLPSSPKSISIRSFRPHDDFSMADDSSYYATAHKNDNILADSSELLQSSAPQFIMPSIKMPSRRPFTDRGKLIGRLKILITGAPGSGKTSLLKSIVQSSEDIVHVDPLPNSIANTPSENPKSSKKVPAKRRRSRELPSVSEVYASTKPFPSWWSDLEDSRVLRRRKSLGGNVLERNLCFVDTSGGSDNDHQTELVVEYMNKQFLRAVSATRSVTSDFQGLLSGNGGSQVDVILYLISEHSMTTDIRHIRRLSNYATVIPLISKSDTLTQTEIASVKQVFVEAIQDRGMKLSCFGPFGDPLIDSGDASLTRTPFAISSANTIDDETMEASILMSPDYVQPLVPSELNFFLNKLFDRENIAWLRHSAAKKLIEAQHIRTHQPATTPTASALKHRTPSPSDSPSTVPPSSVSASHVLVSRSGIVGPSDYTLARVADHTRREEHLAQVRLAKWASDLQQSLQNERERYEKLGRNERAVWLTEKLGECVTDGTLVPISQTPGFPRFGKELGKEREKRSLCVQTRDGGRLEYRINDVNMRDPLGILRWSEDLKRQGWILVLGSMGIVGGLAFWVARVASHGFMA